MTVIVREKADRIFFTSEGKTTVTTFTGEPMGDIPKLDDCFLLDVNSDATLLAGQRYDGTMIVVDIRRGLVANERVIDGAEYQFIPGTDLLLVASPTDVFVDSLIHPFRTNVENFDNLIGSPSLFALGDWHPHLPWYCVPDAKSIVSFDVTERTYVTEKTPVKSPRHLRFDRSGNYYLSDQSEVVRKFTPDLEMIWERRLPAREGDGLVYDLFVLNDRIVVPSDANNDYVFDTGTGEHLATWHEGEGRGRVHAIYDETRVVTDTKKLIDTASGTITDL